MRFDLIANYFLQHVLAYQRLILFIAAAIDTNITDHLLLFSKLHSTVQCSQKLG